MKKYTSEQSGRSMIEMLGVLAIVGVLSVAGIAGYSKAMAKYKTNKLIDQVSIVAANVRTTFAGQGNYKGLTTETAYQLGIYPEEVSKSCDVDGFDEEEGSDKNCLRNAFGGAIYIGGDISIFSLYLTGISKDACSTLLTTDWGTSAGFLDWTGEVCAYNEIFCPLSVLRERGASMISKLCAESESEDDSAAVLVFK